MENVNESCKHHSKTPSLAAAGDLECVRAGPEIVIRRLRPGAGVLPFDVGAHQAVAGPNSLRNRVSLITE